MEVHMFLALVVLPLGIGTLKLSLDTIARLRGMYVAAQTMEEARASTFEVNLTHEERKELGEKLRAALQEDDAASAKRASELVVKGYTRAELGRKAMNQEKH